jgi:CRP-like cAMP-binding protein
MDNMPTSAFEFRIFAPNTPIVNEGEFEDSVYFVKSGSLRVLKLVKFRIVVLLDGSTDLVPLPEHIQVFNHQSPKGSANGRNIVVKLLQVKTISQGEYFGNYRGIIAFSDEDEAEPLIEKERRSVRSISKVTVIANTRSELGKTLFKLIFSQHSSF